MQINVTFASFGEIDEFVTVWARGRSAQAPVNVSNVVTVRGADTRPVTGEGAVIPTGEPQDVSEAEYEAAMSMLHGDEGPQDREPASAGAGEPPSIDPAPEAKPKRKRRTKAEIAADEAAAKAGDEPPAVLDAGAIIDKGDGTDDEPDAPAPQEDGPTDEPPITDTPAELVALAGTIDGADKLAHMNEGRDFISKHGFPKYNETFALADVPANIAAHTPEQAALHRAAMQWLGAQGGAK